jgi:malonate-semialdehyde dehydrogenase (acetylating)/methylmalonate-semialdehyde dehydrogenase
MWEASAEARKQIAWFPFSGWKDSIDGDLHANGTDAVEFYTRKKVLTSRW